MKNTLHQIHYPHLLNLFQKLKNQQNNLVNQLLRLKIPLFYLEKSSTPTVFKAVFIVVLMSIETMAQSLPLGGEFLVNTRSTGYQAVPVVAKDQSGNFVIVWSSSNESGDESIGITAQRFDKDGLALGNEFSVNTHTISDQMFPSIAMDNDGNFVIAWQSAEQDGDGNGIYAQRYDASGAAQGLEFRVNTNTIADQLRPSLAMANSTGDFIVAWESVDQDGSLSNVYAQRYSADGVVQGTEFLVNTTKVYNQLAASVAMDDDGDFVIAWESTDDSGLGIYAQRYNSAGLAQGTEFPVNTETYLNQHGACAAMDANGNFIIGWGNYDYTIYTQRYNYLGVAQGTESKVGTIRGTDYNYTTSISMNSDGNYIVVWGGYDESSSAVDADGGIYAQRYNASGVAQGTEFLVNTYLTGGQLAPTAALDDNGDFVVTWYSFQDLDADDIYAQRYTSITTGNKTPESANSALHVFPNPARDAVTINREGTFNVRIYDLSGHLLKSEIVSDKLLNTSVLKAGVYLLEVENKESKNRTRLVIE